MLKFRITDDRLHLQLVDAGTKWEHKDLKLHFKKHREGYFHDIMYQRKLWDGYDHFIDSENRMGIGLWREVQLFGEKYGYDVEIENLDSLINTTYTKDKTDKFATVLLDGTSPQIDPYDYQLEAFYRALKYKFCSQELATSAGKTLIFFMYLSFLKRKGIITKEKKALLIVPRTSLVNQTADMFITEYNTGLIEWNVSKLGGKNGLSTKKAKAAFANCELLIGTYQSLKNFDPTFFEQFSVIGVDEAHTSRGESIHKILLSAKNVEYKLGLSGTIKIKEEFSDYYKIQEYLGPLMMVVKANYLIEHDHSANVKVKMIDMRYPKDDEFVRKYTRLHELKKQKLLSMKGAQLYDIEKRFIVSYDPRINFIASLCEKLEGNKLVLFTNVKDEYGKRIQERIAAKGIEVHYIDGSVDTDDRDVFKERMEKNRGVVLTASFGTFSTGINLKNVNYIIFAESYKSEITVRQSIGRGMRKLLGKYNVTIIDLIDDVVDDEELEGYVVKHGKVREKIYLREKFVCSKASVDLGKFQQASPPSDTA